MAAESDPTLVRVLLAGIGALAGACAFLFYQLSASQKSAIELAREVLPVIAVLTKLIERLERKEGGGKT